MDNPGLDPAVTEAMKRRMMGAPTPALTQASDTASMQQPLPQPTLPSEMNGSSRPTITPNAPSQKYQPQNQEDLIVLALIEQLKSSNKLKKEEMAMAKPQPMPSQQPMTPMM